MFLEINDISTGTVVTEPLNVMSINYLYVKEEDSKKRIIYVLTNGIRKIEEFDTQSDFESRLQDIHNASMGGLVQKDTYGDFPDKGSKGSVYIAKDTGQTYYWDPATETYIKTGTAGRTGVYVYNGDLPVTIGSTMTINKSDLTEIVPATVDYMDGSEVIGTNATAGLITASTSSSVTVKIIPDMVIDSFQQKADETALPQTGAVNILYYLQDKQEFRVWNPITQEYDSAGSSYVSYITDRGMAGAPINMDELVPGTYYVASNYNSATYIRGNSTFAGMTSITLVDGLIYVHTKYDDANVDDTIATCISKLGSGSTQAGCTIKITKKSALGGSGVGVSYDARGSYYILGNSNQTINDLKTFTTLPQSNATPSNNNDLVNKSYVDNAISGIDLSNYYTKGETDEMIDGIEDLIGDVNTVLASLTTLPSMSTIEERLENVVDVEEPEEQVGE